MIQGAAFAFVEDLAEVEADDAELDEEEAVEEGDEHGEGGPAFDGGADGEVAGDEEDGVGEAEGGSRPPALMERRRGLLEPATTTERAKERSLRKV